MTAASVIIPTFNSASTLGATLAGLAAQDFGEPFEVIVVDDGSQDGTVELAEGAAIGPKVLRQDHAGAATARNRGAAAAAGEALAFIDSDCVPAPGWLREGVAALAGADLVQGMVQPDFTGDPHPLDRSLWVEQETLLYESANLFVDAGLFDRLGGFEDLVGPVEGRPIAEDVWLGWRARRAGARTTFCAAALVHHAVFRRGLGDFVAERRRLAYFPAIAAKIPELRRRLFFARLFLNSRTAALDLGLAGALGAAILASPWPLVALVPYLSLLAWNARGWRRYAPLHATAGAIADLVGFASLAWGSFRARSLLI